jgi:hypothetical protein
MCDGYTFYDMVVLERIVLELAEYIWSSCRCGVGGAEVMHGGDDGT